MEHERVFACLVEGRRFDCGSKLGFLEAQFAFAQKRGELWSGLRQSLGDLLARANEPPPAATPILTASAAVPPVESAFRRARTNSSLRMAARASSFWLRFAGPMVVTSVRVAGSMAETRI